MIVKNTGCPGKTPRLQVCSAGENGALLVIDLEPLQGPVLT